MKKIKILLAAVPLNIVTTTQDLASIASGIGGDHVEVSAIAKGYQDAHFVDAKPSFLLKLRKADLFIQIGLELEVGWAPALLTGARNKKILPGNSGFLEVFEGCDILQKPDGKVDRSQGDVHPYGNPHYWLDPQNGRVVAKNIASRLSEIDPTHAEGYKANLSSFERRLDSKMKEWESIAKKFQGLKAVTYHNSWPNFAKRFGLNIVNFVEPKPGVPPPPAHIKALIEQMKRDQVRLILVEPYFDLRLPRKIASESGAQVLVFHPSVGAVPEAKDYLGLFDHNLKLLNEALEKK